MKTAIVIAGYNRPYALKRLLDSLLLAEYDGDHVPLIISIDKSESIDVASVANNYDWPFGEKRVVLHKERFGLKKHIIECGGYTKEFGAIVMLEDDLYVSPQFYRFSKQTIEKYSSDDNVGGISLYNHLWNVNAGRPFNVADDVYDVYFLQFAQSWGQVWTYSQWEAFLEWYKMTGVVMIDSLDIPSSVSGWSEKSWLKFFVKFIVETNKYFVYPKISLTTNFSDTGENHPGNTTAYQVPLQLERRPYYNLPDFSISNLKYDVFFERIGLERFLNLPAEDVSVDLYGTKRKYKRYLLSSKRMEYQIIKSFGLKMRPHELNIVLCVKGEEIFLYDTAVKMPFTEQVKSNSNIRLNQIKYDVRIISRSTVIPMFKECTLDALWNKMIRTIKARK